MPVNRNSSTAAPSIARVVRTAACGRIAAASLRIACVVGTLLNVINHGEAFWQGAPIPVVHVLLNFLVPFCVSAYSAAKNEVTRQRDCEFP